MKPTIDEWERAGFILVCADMGLALMSVKRPMSLQPLY